MLVEADHVSSGIAETRGDLRGVGADWLDDLAAMGYYGVNGGGYAVYHDAKEEAGLCGRRAPKHPRAAHFVDCIVKRRGAIAAFSDVPAEHRFVEFGRACNVVGGHFDVANFAIRKCRRHGHSLGRRAKARSGGVVVQFFLGGIGAAGAEEAAVAVLAAIGTGEAKMVEIPFVSAMSSRAVDFIAAAKGAKGRMIFSCRFVH